MKREVLVRSRASRCGSVCCKSWAGMYFYVCDTRRAVRTLYAYEDAVGVQRARMLLAGAVTPMAHDR